MAAGQDEMKDPGPVYTEGTVDQMYNLREAAVAASSEALRDQNTGKPAAIGHIIDLAEYIVSGDPYLIRYFKDRRIEQDLAKLDDGEKQDGDDKNPEDAFLNFLREAAPDGVMFFTGEDLANGTVEKTLRGIFND